MVKVFHFDKELLLHMLLPKVQLLKVVWLATPAIYIEGPLQYILSSPTWPLPLASMLHTFVISPTQTIYPAHFILLGGGGELGLKQYSKLFDSIMHTA
jgi:hypothetical protein